MKTLKKHKILIILVLVFFLGLIVRFWWFPDNVYFGYDQARDAIVSQEIYQNKDLKIIGPSAGKEGLYHGPAYWYLIGPLYLLFSGNPSLVLAFLSLLNAAGVFLIYLLAKTIFNQKVGLLAALFYALSFSQSQYSLYFANPSPAVIAIMLFYLGWAFLIFQSKGWGWILIGLGLALSVQFEFFLIYLSLAALLMAFLFRQVFRKINYKYLLLGLIALFLFSSSFFLAEFKYGFKTTKTLWQTLFPGSSSVSSIKLATSTFWERIGTEVLYNVFGFFPKLRETLAVGLMIGLVALFWRMKKIRKEFLFLLVWLGSNYFLDFFGSPQLYYVGIGLAIPVILILSYIVSQFLVEKKLLAFLLIIMVVGSNIKLMRKFNKNGPIPDLYVQEGMLLEGEKKVLDNIYLKAKGEMFIVNALTMPYKIKTTWAYLFNWYGSSKYGYVPYWGGEDVPGFAGTLPLPDSNKYPRFAIFEPMRGIPENLKKEFIDSENGFALPKEKIKIDRFELEKRIPSF